MPAVSIIVPVYNAEPYLRKCVDSILAQTFTDFECILVDDCSPDNCPAICNEYTIKDKRIKIIHNELNIGSSLSRKIGLDNSFGEYIQFIDADDYVEPDMVENVYNYAITNNYDMVCFDCYAHNESNKILYMEMSPVSNNFVQNVKKNILEAGLGGAIWNKLIKRKIYQDIEFPKDGFIEDRYILTQALFFSKNIGYLNKAFYHYIFNTNSLVHNPQKKWDRYYGHLNNVQNIINFLKKHHGEDLSAFEPELSRRIRITNELRPGHPKRIILNIMRVLIPFKVWRRWLRKTFL